MVLRMNLLPHQYQLPIDKFMIMAGKVPNCFPSTTELVGPVKMLPQ